jgi:hypothetical protein
MSERARLAARLAPIGLVGLLAVAWLAPAGGGLRFAAGDEAVAAAWTDAFDALPDEPLVLVGFDADFGTYAEVRPTVRTALADLLNRDARLVFVSLTPEGRALALGELARLARGEANPTRLLDLGFRPGSEAALVALTRDLAVPDDAEGTLARTVAAEGIGVFDAALVVGGNDLGPRSWVEQVRPRVDDLPILAIAPTSLLPELQPLAETGQVSALIATPRDGAAYRELAELGNLDRFRETPEPQPIVFLVGMLAAILVLGQAWAARLASLTRAAERDAGPTAS